MSSDGMGKYDKTGKRVKLRATHPGRDASLGSTIVWPEYRLKARLRVATKN
jgi:hypothetical protein